MPDKYRILIIEDEFEILQVVCLRLRLQGYEVDGASDGGSGLAKALSSHPDAVVIDLRMPVMDGLTVLQKLRQDPDTAHIPVIVLSASLMDQSKTTALDLGASYFLEKPFEVSDLIAAIEAVLAKRAVGGMALPGTR